MTNNSSNHLLSGLSHLPYDQTDLSLAFARLQGQANGHLGFDQFDHTDPTSNHNLGFLGGFLENTSNGFHNVFGNMGNGELGNLMMGLNNGNRNHDQDQEILNPMFHDHQEHMMNNGSTCTATTAVTMTTVKQEACNMMRSSEFGESRSGGGVLWGFPWQIGGGGGNGDQGNMGHEVESGRSQIGGWNGIGSTVWHGLIDSPLM